MHNAPSVSCPVGRPLVAGVAAALVWLAGAAVTLLWTLEVDVPGWRQVTAACALAVAGAWSLRSWLRSATGELHWDGGGWMAPGASGVGELDVALDLQSILLVRWRAAANSRWLWLERRRVPQRWADVRRAVYSRSAPPPLAPASPPPAIP
jgi:toxin CptA